MVRSHSVLFPLLFAFAKGASRKSCYYPDGSIARDDLACDELIPSGSDVAVPCCGPGRYCMPNRLCLGRDNQPMRGSCTDESWTSDNCPQFCFRSPYAVDCAQGPGSSGDHHYCCLEDGANCCLNNSSLFVANVWNFGTTVTVTAAAPTSSTSSSTTSTSSPTPSTTSTSTSSTSSASTSSSPSPASSLSSSSSSSTTSSNLSATSSSITTKVDPVVADTGSHTHDSTTSTSMYVTSIPTAPAAATHSKAERDWTGVGVGVGIGVAGPLLALAIIGPLLWRRHRRKVSRELLLSDMYHQDSVSSRSTSTRTTKEPLIRMHKPANLYEAGGAPSYELDAYSERAELSTKSPRELPGADGERQRYVAYRPPH